ncbi:MAG TPA: SDR family oxidoreductase [Anaeromyxobacteraceae bacterium]|nr:SDR family oxidoreductase [Anaeromyxobacteraceae bacterium]
MGRYDGKRVVITGGTTGIGLATAKLLLGEGARVLVTGRRKETLDSARAEFGKSAIVLQSDATSLRDIDALAAHVQSEFGALDFLFLNAGYGKFAPLEVMSEAVYDEMLNLHTKGPYFAVLKLAPLMPSGSAIVLTTSAASVKGIPMLSAYGAGKAALRSLARSFASELAPRGIRVNAVSPLSGDTPILLQSGLPKDQQDGFLTQLRETNPMKRLGRPEEIAKAVAFLAFDATFTNGHELPVDGGMTQL